MDLINKISQSFTDLGIALGLIAVPQDLFLPFQQDVVGQSPLVTGLMFLIDNIIPALNTAIVFVNQNFEAFKGAIMGVGAVLAGAAIAAILSGIITVMSAILSPIGLLIIAAGALGAAWATNWGGIREKTAAVVAFVTGIVMALVSTFQSQVLPPLQAAFDNLTQSLNKVGLDWGDVWNAILEAIKIVAIGIGIAIGLVVTVMVGFVSGMASAMQSATAFIDDFGRFFTMTLTGIVNVIDGVVGFVQAIFAGEWAQAWDSFWQIAQGAQEIFLGTFGLMSTAFQTILNNALAFIVGFVQGVIDIFTNLSSVLVGNSIIPDMVARIVETFQMMIQPILSTFDRLSEGISNILGSLFAGAGGGEGLNLDLSMLTQTLPQAIADNVTLIQGMITALGGLVDSLGVPIQSAVKKFQEAMTSGFSMVFNQLDAITKSITLMTTKLLPTLALVTDDTTTEMEAAFKDVAVVINSIKNSIFILSTSMSTLGTTMGTLGTNIGTVSSKIVTLTQKLENLNVKLGKTKSKAEDAADAFESFNNARDRIGEVKTVLDGIVTTLDAIIKKSIEASAALAGLNTQPAGPTVRSQLGASLVGSRQAGSVSTVNNTSTSNQTFNISFAGNGGGISEAEASLLMRQNIQRQLSTV